MARKYKLKKVLEPDTGIVHFKASPLADQWSLCGGTDRIGQEKVTDTDDLCSCALCIDIAMYCQGAKVVNVD